MMSALLSYEVLLMEMLVQPAPKPVHGQHPDRRCDEAEQCDLTFWERTDDGSAIYDDLDMRGFGPAANRAASAIRESRV
jgi:hypothetical protein